MNRILLQPASGPEASEHYTITMDPGVSMSVLDKFLIESDFQKLKLLELNYIKTWGFIPRPDGSPPSHWLNLEESDFVVFSKKGRFYFFGVIYSKVHHKKLAESLWGENKDGRTWEYIYFINDGKQIDVPYIPSVLGYADNYPIYGSVLLNEHKSSELLNYLQGKEIDLSDEDQLGNTDEENKELSKKYAPPISDEDILKKIQQIATEIGSKTVKERIKLAKYISRNPTYASLVKKKAKYICQICGAAPFIQKNGLPYAEAHHIDELAIKRIDNPLRMMCVCPTCHAIIHYGNDSALQSRLKKS